jgi:hypothetical protein
MGDCLLWTVFITKVTHILGYFSTVTYSYGLILAKKWVGVQYIWATFSLTHLATLPGTDELKNVHSQPVYLLAEMENGSKHQGRPDGQGPILQA